MGHPCRWVVHIICRRNRSCIKIPLEGDKLKYTAHLQYQTTNNEVEYEAFLKGLKLAKSLRVESIVIQGDSQLIIGQVNGTCEAKEERMKKYLSRVKRLIKKFKEADFLQIQFPSFSFVVAPRKPLKAYTYI